MTKPARKLDPLDARTLRWVHQQALRGRLKLPMTDGERSFNAALEFVGGKCRDKARAIESRQPRKLTPATTLCGPVPKRGKR